MRCRVSRPHDRSCRAPTWCTPSASARSASASCASSSRRDLRVDRGTLPFRGGPATPARTDRSGCRISERARAASARRRRCWPRWSRWPPTDPASRRAGWPRAETAGAADARSGRARVARGPREVRAAAGIRAARRAADRCVCPRSDPSATRTRAEDRFTASACGLLRRSVGEIAGAQNRGSGRLADRRREHVAAVRRIVHQRRVCTECRLQSSVSCTGCGCAVLRCRFSSQP